MSGEGPAAKPIAQEDFERSKEMFGPVVQRLLGCEWGRRVRTADDPQPCGNVAVQVVVLHDGDRQLAYKVCEDHRDRLLEETTPHDFEVSDGES